MQSVGARCVRAASQLRPCACVRGPNRSGQHREDGHRHFATFVIVCRESPRVDTPSVNSSSELTRRVEQLFESSV